MFSQTPGQWRRGLFAVLAASVAGVAFGTVVFADDGMHLTQPGGVEIAATQQGPARQDHVKKAKPPRPATMTRVARHVPADPLDGGHGRRIVYDKALMTVWIVGRNDQVVRDYPVTGRWDRPLAGKYRVYSKSPTALNPYSKAKFDDMVRFAYGSSTGARIGFHAIPVFYESTERGEAGTRMSSVDDLGLPIATGGCVRQANRDARFLYRWSRIGDRVVVLPSP